MKDAIHVVVLTLFALLLMLSATQIAAAQDPVKVDPQHYKVLYENNAVRILSYHDTPGHKVPKHSHPNYFVYVISDATRLFTDWNAASGCTGDGKTVKLTAGESIRKPPTTHCEENTGNTNTDLLVVEFKGVAKAGRSHRSKRRL